MASDDKATHEGYCDQGQLSADGKSITCEVCNHTKQGNQAHFGISSYPASKGMRAHSFRPRHEARQPRRESMGQELLPCPFCGGAAQMQEISDINDENHGANYIECEECGASTNLQFSCKDDARPDLIGRWNTRKICPYQLCDQCGERTDGPHDELCQDCKGV